MLFQGLLCILILSVEILGVDLGQCHCTFSLLLQRYITMIYCIIYINKRILMYILRCSKWSTVPGCPHNQWLKLYLCFTSLNMGVKYFKYQAAHLNF